MDELELLINILRILLIFIIIRDTKDVLKKKKGTFLDKNKSVKCVADTIFIIVYIIGLILATLIIKIL